MARIFWIVAIVLPIILPLLFQYIVSSPWNCQGLCCFRPQSCTQTSVNGSYKDKYEPVVKALEHSLTSGWDLGASLHVIVDGETAIDVAGGFRDKRKTQIYDTSTLNLIFSCGKIIETIAIAILVDKGVLDYEEPIATYWPEFAQKNKGNVTMKDILSHRSGTFFDFDVEPSEAILQDSVQRDAFMASQEYPTPVGTVWYRAWGSGFVSDAVCRRVDPMKRSLADLVKDEIFSGLGEQFFSPPDHKIHLEGSASSIMTYSEVYDASISTLLFGLMPQIFLPAYSSLLPDKHFLKLRGESEQILFKKLILKSPPFDRPTIPDAGKATLSFNNQDSFLSYPMMSGNSISNARALCKTLDAFRNGRIVGKDTYETFMQPFDEAYDHMLMLNYTHTAGGWAINDRTLIPVDGLDCVGWFGIGGSMIQSCVVGEHSFTFSYVVNLMSPRAFSVDRGVKLLEELTVLLKD